MNIIIIIYVDLWMCVYNCMTLCVCVCTRAHSCMLVCVCIVCAHAYVYVCTVRSEIFVVLNFRGFHGTARHPRKIKSANILYDPLCSALCTGVLAKNKEAGVLNVSYIPCVFSSVMHVDQVFFTPIRRSISD